MFFVGDNTREVLGLPLVPLARLHDYGTAQIASLTFNGR